MKEISLENVAPIVGSTAWELMEEGKKEEKIQIAQPSSQALQTSAQCH